MHQSSSFPSIFLRPLKTAYFGQNQDERVPKSTEDIHISLCTAEGAVPQYTRAVSMAVSCVLSLPELNLNLNLNLPLDYRYRTTIVLYGNSDSGTR